MRPLSPPSARAARTANGFTLVELLLAAAIAVLVAALAWSLLSTTTRSVESQMDRARGPAAAAAAIDQLRSDLNALFIAEDDPVTALELQSGSDQPFSLTFCTIRATGRTPDLVWTEPRRVEYRLAASGADEAASLVRLEQSLSGPIETVTNTVLDRVTALNLAFSDGETWHATWPPADQNDARPRAARATIQSGSGEPAEAEFWLPIGHAVTSRLLRTGQSAPE
ncbi:MAG TPA: type II secretion system protein GspJ [Kiritimatiellia bacterium]|nr:type II secretion system protein GspJ [Kiritimatiellia bacterium]